MEAWGSGYKNKIASRTTPLERTTAVHSQDTEGELKIQDEECLLLKQNYDFCHCNQIGLEQKTLLCAKGALLKILHKTWGACLTKQQSSQLYQWTKYVLLVWMAKNCSIKLAWLFWASGKLT